MGVHTKRQVAFFRGVLIEQGDSTVVIKHQDRIKKLDSVLAQVGFRLLGVPFELRLSRPSVYYVHQDPCDVHLASAKGEVGIKAETRSNAIQNFWQICGRIGGKTQLLGHQWNKPPGKALVFLLEIWLVFVLLAPYGNPGST